LAVEMAAKDGEQAAGGADDAARHGQRVSSVAPRFASPTAIMLRTGAQQL
jgi:hypothetical protein